MGKILARVLSGALTCLMSLALSTCMIAASPIGKSSPSLGSGGRWNAVVLEGRDANRSRYADGTASQLRELGIETKVFYSCNESSCSGKGTGWSVVLPALREADIVVYWGHGSEDWRFSLDYDTTYGISNPRRDGRIYSQVVEEDQPFKSNALVMMMGVCYSSGTSASDPVESVSQETAKYRIENYANTFLRYGKAKLYIANSSTFDYMIQGYTLGEAFDKAAEDQGKSLGLLTIADYNYPYVANGELVFFGRTRTAPYYPEWNNANVGDPNTRIQDILPGFTPQNPPPDDPQPPPDNNTQTQNFNEFILLQNPNDVPVTVKTYLFTATNQTYEITRTLQPKSRDTIWLNEFLPNEEMSAWVHDESGKGVIAERSMYFNYKGCNGGSNAMGITRLSGTWYFAEGYTSPDFDSYILVGNTTDSNVNASIDFKGPGVSHTQPLYIPPRSRQTIHVNSMPGFSFTEYTAKITSTESPVVAEQAQYFSYQGNDGGSVEHGASSPQEEWYFAEGYTAEQFDTYVLTYNPNSSVAECVLTLTDTSGSNTDVPFTLAPDTRQTFKLDDIPGYESAQVAFEITANVPVIAERTMYFNYMGKRGGTASCGSNAANTTWYLAEGYTGGEFDTFILLYNPGDKEASVNLRFQTDAGQVVPIQESVLPHSRFTVKTDDVLTDSSFSTAIDSTEPILVERAMYFNFQGRMGGHASAAVTSSSPDWYFGEGYTGD